MPNETNACWTVTMAADAAGKKTMQILAYGPMRMFKYFDEDVSPHEIATRIQQEADVEKIELRINSYGGDMYAGLALMSFLRSHPAKVTAYVDGIAASAATLILMGADERIMPANAMIFIHNPASGAFGESKTLAKLARDLDEQREAVIAGYAEVTGQPREAIIKLMDDATWMSAKRAKQLGFVTHVQRRAVAASLEDDAVVINGCAMDFTDSEITLTPEVEQALLGTPAEEQLTVAITTVDTGVDDVTQDTTQEAGRSSEAIDSTTDGENSAEEAAETADDNAAHGDDATAAASPDPPAQQNTPLPSGEGQGEGSGVADATAAECARIRAITELAEQIPGSAALAHRACFDEPMSVQDFAIAAHTDPAVLAARHLAARAADAAIINQIPPAGVPPVETTNDAAQTINKKYWPYS